MSVPKPSSAAVLQQEDLARFNHWLWITRLRSVGALLMVALVLAYVEPGTLTPGSIAAVAIAALVLSVTYRWWLRSRLQLRLLIYVQLAADTLALLAGLYFVNGQAVLFHFLLLLVVVPASMVEWQCGAAMATLASAGHFWLMGVAGSTDWFSAKGLLPPASFFIIASQSLFYAQHLEQKNKKLAAAAVSRHEANRRLEEEATIAAALLRAAQALTASLDPHQILTRLNEVIRDVLHCEWSVTLLRDQAAEVYRVAAISGTEPEIVDEVRTVAFPVKSAALFAAAEREGMIAVEAPDSPLFPAALMARWHVSSFLCASLERAGTVVGLLAAGFNERTGPFSQRETRLFRSIAQQAAIALENARLVESLRGASRLKSEFIGTMSHELRSPLNVVIGYTELLLDDVMGPLAAEQRQALEQVRQHGFELADLIQETLDVNRLEAGHLPIDIEVFTVASFIDELKKSIPLDWDKPGLMLGWHVDPPSIALRSDRTKLKKVLRNLIHNALKFTERGTVTVNVTADDGWVDFAVSDTGIGIPPEALPIIFEMFRQVDGSSTRRHGGVGLGLYIVKQLVRGLGGEVSVSSVPGSGSTFHVRLRQADQAIVQAALAGRENGGLKAGASPPSGSTGPGQ